jgi:hypothetical protein
MLSASFPLRSGCYRMCLRLLSLSSPHQAACSIVLICGLVIPIPHMEPGRVLQTIPARLSFPLFVFDP